MVPNGHPLPFMEMAQEKMISSNPNSSNPTSVAFVVHPISLWGEEMHVMSFRVRRNIFPIFEQTRQNWHEMTRAGVVQKAPDTFLRGAYLTPVCLRGAYWTPLPTDTTRQWHAMTRMFCLLFQKNRDPFRPTWHGNDTKWHIFLEAVAVKSRKNAPATMNTSLFVSSGP